MTLPLKSIPGFVSDMVTSWVSQTGLNTTFSDGDPLLALWQSVATQLDFLQALAQIVVALSRAQTSTGADLDSWMAQFNFTRLPSNHATGLETFQIGFPSGTAIIVPLGTTVQTVGGGVLYEVVADTTQGAYNAAAGGYVLAVGATSVSATVEALVGGSASNVLANTLTQFGTSIPGIQSCTNPAPISNGLDAESDAAFRARFVLYLSTLARATESAIRAAAGSVQQGLLINLLENQTPTGTSLVGCFTVIADDGSGNPPTSLLNAIFNAVDEVRAFSVQPFVVGPSTLTANIAIAVRLVAGNTTVPAVINTAVQNAIATVVNALAPGDTLYGSSIIIAALSVSGVQAVNAASLAINSGSADLVPTASQEIRTAVGSISVSNY